MKSNPANCPSWLERKILEEGGEISFYDFMNIALNDKNNGYYGSGKAQIGRMGDFVTSPSLTDDFSFLLSKQIEEWLLEIINKIESNKKLTILEFGSGDGSLLRGVIKYFLEKNKEFIKKISFEIFEPNNGMRSKQKDLLNQYLDQGIEIKWLTLEELKINKFDGIVLAHEVFDAFPVERVQYSKGTLFQQVVSLNKDKKLFLNKAPLTSKLIKRIDFIQSSLEISIPPLNAPLDWTNEIHIDNYLWLKNVYESINNGILLVIDYSLDAKRYYSPNKYDGNLVAYNKQKMTNNILKSPGDYDLTTHLCNEILILDAEMAGFKFDGMLKQGEALLSLGLAEMIFDIQEKYKNNISEALLQREALLRLVDPICLGDFKWFVFQKTLNKELSIKTKILTI
tara:strand:+ start:578 stop:1768 length:1191 start_codon:yes stop_codon:yes gene_type:complete